PVKLAALVAAATVQLGILGNTQRFEQLTGQTSAVHHVIVGWGQGQTWGSNFTSLFASLGVTPMVGFSTAQGSREMVTPLQLANGAGDSYRSEERRVGKEGREEGAGR